MEPDEMNTAPGQGMPDAAFSPVLRQAMQEILAICRKHDIGAYLLLASKQHTEERTRFPTWSVAHVESEGGRNAIRFRTKDRKKECVPWTLNMLDAFYMQPGMMALNMQGVIEMLKTHMDFDTQSRRGPDAPSWDFK
jgi:hypothetical protein